MVQFLDPETAKILQFLDPEIVEMEKKILDPEIVEMVWFLDPEIVEKVDKSYIDPRGDLSNLAVECECDYAPCHGIHCEDF